MSGERIKDLDLSGATIKRDFSIKLEDNQLGIRDFNNKNKFVKDWHYSKSVKGLKAKYVFSLNADNKIIGIAIFGTPAGINTAKHYSGDKEVSECLELRRLCVIDKTPKNTESYFIGNCLRFLKKNTKVHTILSYSDPNQGHRGTIYKASNFEYKGKDKSGNSRAFIWKGKTYHSRIYGNTKKEEFKKDMKLGKVKTIKLLNKDVFLYKLNKRA